MAAALLFALAGILLAGALFLGLWWLLSLRETQRAARRVTTDILPMDEDLAVDRWWQLFAEPGARMDRWFDENGETERLLAQAALRSAAQRAAYFAAQAVLPLCGLGAVVLGFIVGRLNGFEGFIGSFIIIILSLLAPRWWLKARASARQRRIRGEVAMFIHLLALLFDAGLSLRQALSSLVREGQHVLPALGVEVRQVLRQLEAGADPAESLLSMGRLLDVAELSAVLSVLRQVDRYGGELREPLMESLAVVEERRQLSLREKVNGLSGRMTVVMVLFFFPALLIFVAGPAFLSVLRALGGQG